MQNLVYERRRTKSIFIADKKLSVSVCDKVISVAEVKRMAVAEAVKMGMAGVVVVDEPVWSAKCRGWQVLVEGEWIKRYRGWWKR